MAVRKRKGVMLLQALVLSVLLSMIAVMVMKWVMGRYMLSARVYRSSAFKVRTEGCASRYFVLKVNEDMGLGGPPSRNCSADDMTVQSTYSGNEIDSVLSVP